jgi:hypothetical protein
LDDQVGNLVFRKDGKNVFIAECKSWKGEKAFGETLDQLLSYLSWRDTKTAVVLFNRNADFSTVLGKIAEIAPRHANFKRDLGESDESSSGSNKLTFVFLNEYFEPLEGGFCGKNAVCREFRKTILFSSCVLDRYK